MLNAKNWLGRIVGSDLAVIYCGIANELSQYGTETLMHFDVDQVTY
jgi:hypothetical protein